MQRYSLLLDTVHKNTLHDTEEKANILRAIEEIKAVTHECDAKVDQQTKKVELIELSSKLFLRPGMERVELQLDQTGRELIFKGDLQRAGANRFTWLETHAILFDHYLVLAKTDVRPDGHTGRKKELYDVSKLVSFIYPYYDVAYIYSQFPCNSSCLTVPMMIQLSNLLSKVLALSLLLLKQQALVRIQGSVEP